MIKNFFKSQLASVIEWKDQAPDVLWYKYPSNKDEIKHASKLIVSPGQGCVLVYEGKVQDILLEPNTYVLDTDNHPFITSLLKVRQFFESEHKLKIFFFRTAQVLDQQWGTDSPIKYMDTSYQIPVQLGLHGNFTYTVRHPMQFFEQIVGAQDTVRTADLSPMIVDRFLDKLRSYFSKSSLPFNTIDAELSNISEALTVSLRPELERLGLELVDFNITGTQFDEATIERIGKIADVSIDVQSAQTAGLSYEEMEKLKALRDAARNEGGLAGIGAQMGVGMEIGKVFSQEKDKAVDSINQLSDDVVEKLRKLKILLQEQIITDEEFDKLKSQILKSI